MSTDMIIVGISGITTSIIVCGLYYELKIKALRKEINNLYKMLADLTDVEDSSLKYIDEYQEVVEENFEIVCDKIDEHEIKLNNVIETMNKISTVDLKRQSEERYKKNKENESGFFNGLKKFITVDNAVLLLKGVKCVLDAKDKVSPKSTPKPGSKGKLF